MNTTLPWLLNASVAALIIFGIVGCSQNHHAKRVVAESPMALGTQSDDIWRMQEENAEAAKFIVYDHEFMAPDVTNGMTSGGWRLNSYGEDHVKQIAANLNRGDIYPVIVERSQITPDPRSEFKYPVHFNEDLDSQRRQIIVASLAAMGVENADERVVVAPSFAEGITGSEARRAYIRGTIGGRGQRTNGGGGGISGRFGVGFGGF